MIIVLKISLDTTDARCDDAESVVAAVWEALNAYYDDVTVEITG